MEEVTVLHNKEGRGWTEHNIVVVNDLALNIVRQLLGLKHTVVLINQFIQKHRLLEYTSMSEAILFVKIMQMLSGMFHLLN